MIGQTLGSYRIVEQVGMGGMATVYKAYDPGTDRYVAIKILPAHYSQDPTFRERFRREAKAIARLEHPHILPIHAYGEEGDTAYLLMRFLPTGTLKQHIERGALPYGEASAMLTQIADGLDYAHKRGILHRDIKPSNILLDESGNAYLSDFGIARMIGSAGDLTGTGMLGTPAYMSPEQCAGSRDLSPASDQYALGVVLYEMVTGRTPFQAETPLALIQMHLSAPLPPPHLLRPDLPEAVEGVILKTLSRSPQDRWTTCGEMADAFNRAIGESGIAAYVPPMRSGETTAEGVELTFGETMPAPPPTVRAKSRGVPMWMVGLAGVVVIGLIIGGLALAGMLGNPATSGSPVSEHEATLTMSAGTAQSIAGTSQAQSANRTATVAAGGPTETPAQTGTLSLLERGERLELCSGDICINGKSIGLATTYTSIRDEISWSPDGTRLVFAGCLLTDVLADPTALCETELVIVDRDGQNPVSLITSPGCHNRQPAWSPDGEWIAMQDCSSLGIIRPDGTGARILVQYSDQTTPLDGIAWSPDSQSIAWLGGYYHPDAQYTNWVWVINRDGSNANPLYYSGQEHFAANRIAWSPDGKFVAVKLQNGTMYEIDANCVAQATGCDESSRTILNSFPAHWLRSFYPQWAGEFDAPTPTAAPASAGDTFAAPILAAIADRVPDFEDDFSTSDVAWQFSDSRIQIAQGVLRIAIPETESSAGVGVGHPMFSDPDFVLELDILPTALKLDSSITVFFRDISSLPHYKLAILPDIGRWQFWLCNPTAATYSCDVLFQGSEASFALGSQVRLRLIARGNQFAAHVNDREFMFVTNNAISQGRISVTLEIRAGDADVTFDNLKYWNLGTVSGLP